ncbi:uncharacterized protein LOC123447565 [Hordeum vulgare subsp. vulgare]|uniref:uncharacterized protein LOC123447565 n=1 Tax=Hordeum vulgare subsp. vulgare TaxID=112509 RepID=UPI000B480610|nr:uncharacterized protein LOC123447565 [Hordeum vulgare subsp. vulgare]XP_044980109.1 uncharacterized protein LOC123447565 [Hordeum vulgare subsp. vulgare]
MWFFELQNKVLRCSEINFRCLASCIWTEVQRWCGVVWTKIHSHSVVFSNLRAHSAPPPFPIHSHIERRMVWQRILRPAVPLPWLRLGQGRLRLAPVANQRNSPLLHCSASGGDGGGRTDKVLEEQRKRRAELTARISSDEFTAQGPGWLAPVAARLVKLGPPGELAAGMLAKVAGGAQGPGAAAVGRVAGFRHRGGLLPAVLRPLPHLRRRLPPQLRAQVFPHRL